MIAKKVFESINDLLKPRQFSEEEQKGFDILKQIFKIINSTDYRKYLDDDLELAGDCSKCVDPRDIAKLTDIYDLIEKLPYKEIFEPIHNIINKWEDGFVSSSQTLEDLKDEIFIFTK